MSWSAARYLTFEDERTRPVHDLLAAVPNVATRLVADLGCGPGNSTAVLAGRHPDARVIGVDSSTDMIATARARLPDATFEQGDIAAWAPSDRFDVILANASLHWVADHADLLQRLAGRLAPGGSLAIQLPDNLDEPAQTLMRSVAADGPWAAKLEGLADGRTEIEQPAWYYRLLRPHCTRVQVWRTTYYHALPGGAAAIVEWFAGTGLLPFLAPLDTHEQAAYLAHYRNAVAVAYPTLPDGSVLLPMPRLFLVATR